MLIGCAVLQYTSRAAAARDAQQLLQEAHKQAQRKEAEMLEAADAGVIRGATCRREGQSWLPVFAPCSPCRGW
jgi:hypothetical protein